MLSLNTNIASRKLKPVRIMQIRWNARNPLHNLHVQNKKVKDFYVKLTFTAQIWTEKAT